VHKQNIKKHVPSAGQGLEEESIRNMSPKSDRLDQFLADQAAEQAAAQSKRKNSLKIISCRAFGPITTDVSGCFKVLVRRRLRRSGSTWRLTRALKC